MATIPAATPEHADQREPPARRRRAAGHRRPKREDAVGQRIDAVEKNEREQGDARHDEGQHTKDDGADAS